MGITISKKKIVSQNICDIVVKQDFDNLEVIFATYISLPFPTYGVFCPKLCPNIIISRLKSFALDSIA